MNKCEEEKINLRGYPFKKPSKNTEKSLRTQPTTFNIYAGKYIFIYTFFLNVILHAYMYLLYTNSICIILVASSGNVMYTL